MRGLSSDAMLSRSAAETLRLSGNVERYGRSSRRATSPRTSASPAGQKGRPHQPHAMSKPVAPDTRRRVRPVRRRLVGVMPSGANAPEGGIPAFYPMGCRAEARANEGDREQPAAASNCGGPCRTKRVPSAKADVIPPRGFGPQPPSATIRVEVPSGPFNRAGVGSPCPGNGRGRA